jgi:biotin synthase
MTIEEGKRLLSEGEQFSADQVLSMIENVELVKILQFAKEVRDDNFGSVLDVCTITNAKSGACTEDCKWCSQSMHNNCEIEEYDLVECKSVVETVKRDFSEGVSQHSLVTSGHSMNDEELNGLIPIYKALRECSTIGLCASMGLLNYQELLRLYKEGDVRRYHCNLETAPSFFPDLVTTHTIEEKITTIKTAQQIGMKICSGGIIGMGESMEQRIELAILLQELQVDSIPLNIFTPIKGSPLYNKLPLAKEEILLSFAVFRLINPKAHIRLAGGRLLIKEFEKELLDAGVSAIMTGDYLTTQGNGISADMKKMSSYGYQINKEMVS